MWVGGFALRFGGVVDRARVRAEADTPYIDETSLGNLFSLSRARDLEGSDLLRLMRGTTFTLIQDR